MPVNDGGPAFPRPDSTCSEADAVNGTTVPGSEGMSLRAYIATQTFAALLAAPVDEYGDGGLKRALNNSPGYGLTWNVDPRRMALLAVHAADALLESLQAREQTKK